MTLPGSSGPRVRGAAIAAPLAVFAIALAVRLIGLHHTPYVDELNHVMAAHSLLERGTLQLDPGGEPYSRARLFTYLIAALFRVFGESLAIARIPAVLGGAALITALFVWVRSVAGKGAAWTAAMLFCFQPQSLYLSQLARFYTIQTLCFFVAATLVFRVVTDGTLDRRRIAWSLAAALLLLLVALHLQVITIVPVAALCAWAIADGAISWRAAHASEPLRRTHVYGALVIAALILVAAATAVRGGLAARGLALFSYVDLWAEANRHNVRYYHDIFLDQYATIWTLFPLLVLLAIARARRAALFCVAIFAVVFVVHSLAAWKAERYLFTAMPMFFALAGMGLAEGARRVRPAIEDTVDWASRRTLSTRTHSRLTALVFALVAAFALVGNGATSYAIKMLRTSDADWQLALLYRGQPDWDAAAPVLGPAADSSAVLVSTSELKSLYYLHRLDVLLSVDYLGDPRHPGAQFSTFRKLAKPVVSTSESLDALRACFPTGLIVSEKGQWRTPWSIQPAVADYIESTMERVALPASTRILAFRWRTAIADSTADCTMVHGVVHR
jgi:4-amino-4-deoxy-L-arabinose transferase-like glycosyltransferase